jgi:two-component system cell cycle sensor histidine kinase/response regulator CckA
VGAGVRPGCAVLLTALFVGHLYRLSLLNRRLALAIRRHERTHAALTEAQQQRLVREEQMRQSQKMEATGTLAAGVAHDFNNALTVIMGQVILTLAINARDAMPGGGRLRLSVAFEPPDNSTAGAASPTAPNSGYAVLSVEDSGVGISDEIRERIFEPFFTTKTSMQRPGLGLAIAHEIVTEHGGRIEIESPGPTGAWILISLPLSDAPKNRLAAIEPTGSAPGRGQTLVLAEDNVHIRTLLAKQLTFGGYQVIEPTDGTEFLNVLKTHGDGVALVIFDVGLPGKDGPTCLREARSSGMRAPAIAISGLPPSDTNMFDPDDVTYVQKPFMMADIVAMVARKLARN